MNLLFKQWVDPESSTYTYMFGDASTKEIAIVDSVREHLSFYEEEIKKNDWKLCYVIETHTHADHVTAAGMLQKKFPLVEIVVSEKSEVTEKVLRTKNGQKLKCGNCEFQIFASPGHTPDSISILIDGHRLLTGDCMFIGSCGRTDFQNGSAKEMFVSLNLLASLDSNVLVYPAHDYNGRTVSTIGEEKKKNAQLQHASEEAFLKDVGAWNLPPPKKIKEAVPANLKCGLP